MPTAHIVALDTTDRAYLYHTDAIGVLRCHLDIDLTDGRISCGWTGQRGWIPKPVRERRVLRFGIPPLTNAYATQLLRDAVPYAQRMIDGATIFWDGSNHVAELDAAAICAHDDLSEHIANSYPDAPEMTVAEIHARDWIADPDPLHAAAGVGITADTTDQALRHRADQLDNEIADYAESVAVPAGSLAYLTELRDALRAEVRASLEYTRDQVGSLHAQRDKLIRQIFGWNTDSLRGIAQLAGVSHTQVDRINKGGTVEEAA